MNDPGLVQSVAGFSPRVVAGIEYFLPRGYPASFRRWVVRSDTDCSPSQTDGSTHPLGGVHEWPIPAHREHSPNVPAPDTCQPTRKYV